MSGIFLPRDVSKVVVIFSLQVVEASDVVLEVLDARDPLGCRCFQVEQAVLSSGTNKKLILVLNKIGKYSVWEGRERGYIVWEGWRREGTR